MLKRALPQKNRLRRARGTAPEPFYGSDRVLSAASIADAANGSCRPAYFSRKNGTAAILACWQAGNVPTSGENDMRLSKLAAGAILGAGFLAASAMSASAAIVCSGNVCWHTHETYTYPPESKVIVHEDNWKWGPTEKFTFREHEGRGYWRGGRWVTW